MQLNGFPKHACKIDKNWLFNNLSIYKIKKNYTMENALYDVLFTRWVVSENWTSSWIKIIRAHFPCSKLYISLDQLTPLSAVTISGVIRIDIDQFVPLIIGRRKESFHWYPVWFGQLRLKFAQKFEKNTRSKLSSNTTWLHRGMMFSRNSSTSYMPREWYISSKR